MRADRENSSGAPPVETEIKLRIAGPEEVAARLAELGFAVCAPRVFERNQVYDTPTGELRARGELLRLRSAGNATILTFKGQVTAGKHKSRPETEVEAASFDALDSILRQLGYRVQFRYEKYRTEFARASDPGVVTLDETPIGTFLELEGEANWIDRTARDLGFSESDYILASYGTLFLQHRAQSRTLAEHMVFPDAPS